MNKYLIEFTQEEIQTLAAGLGELPYKLAVSLMNKLQDEVTKQEGDKPKDNNS